MTYARLRRRCALIVEEDLGLGALGTLVLEEFDLSVRQVSTAEEAIERLASCGGSIDLVVAEIDLPGRMDGVALARSVGILWPGISIIVTSDSGDLRARDLPAGVVFIPKPWRPLDIVSATEKAARADHSVHALRL